MKILRSYRLSQETIDLIEYLAEELEANNTTIIEQCVHFTVLRVSPELFYEHRKDNNFIEAIPIDKIRNNSRR